MEARRRLRSLEASSWGQMELERQGRVTGGGGFRPNSRLIAQHKWYGENSHDRLSCSGQNV